MYTTFWIVGVQLSSNQAGETLAQFLVLSWTFALSSYASWEGPVQTNANTVWKEWCNLRFFVSLTIYPLAVSGNSF
jgi:hypothetical protein